MIERQIAQTIVHNFVQAGITDWYHEVPHPGHASTGQRADLIARLDDALVVIECKAKLSLDLIIQATRWVGWAEYINVCFADAPKGWQDAVGPLFQGWGIGVLRVDLVAGRLEKLYEDNPHVAPFRGELEPLLTIFRDGTHAPGGSAGGHYVTLGAEQFLKIRDYVVEHPGHELEDAMKVAGIGVTKRERERVVDALRRLQIPGVIGRKFGDTWLLYPGGKLA